MRRVRIRAAIDVHALYTAAALARHLGVRRERMLQLLAVRGVIVFGVGKGTLVPLSEIRDKLPPLWESILLAERVRHGLDVT